jgi:hypothetical protein
MSILVRIALAGFLAAAGLQTPPPEVPAALKAPVGEKLVFQAHATGSQIYVCQAGADQKFSWVLKGPEAELFDAKGEAIGHHSAGPSWKHNDGSLVTGKVVARQDAPEPDAIPWLLLQAAGHTGTGILSSVTTIQRVHTQGGQPPKTGGCDQSTRDKEVKSQYSADYYFYAPGP